uniref:Uncharacterized protein n=1 Tax=Chromera velia CCMP2878 TaxID=1169474 RepID=A0A0K6SA81_9ALVE|eukprot:Cvel_9544.t3-p1 / transcript=Cvel_9544.t3 / gene=Cvel_9544 / organism=Chromera_velia_CCMP2878 / gene_product=hypothetical protein / transcript_product=hypothetical protein / location=Cvel_scaffold553:11772-22040(-) / protein_length=2755 / sequence_SO=supercontig / SO=protein_coding / is_pseudo=false
MPLRRKLRSTPTDRLSPRRGFHAEQQRPYGHGGGGGFSHFPGHMSTGGSPGMHPLGGGLPFSSPGAPAYQLSNAGGPGFQTADPRLQAPLQAQAASFHELSRTVLAPRSAQELLSVDGSPFRPPDYVVSRADKEAFATLQAEGQHLLAGGGLQSRNGFGGGGYSFTPFDAEHAKQVAFNDVADPSELSRTLVGGRPRNAGGRQMDVFFGRDAEGNFAFVEVEVPEGAPISDPACRPVVTLQRRHLDSTGGGAGRGGVTEVIDSGTFGRNLLLVPAPPGSGREREIDVWTGEDSLASNGPGKQVCTVLADGHTKLRSAIDLRGRRVTVLEKDVAGRCVVLAADLRELKGNLSLLHHAQVVDSDERGLPLRVIESPDGPKTVVGTGVSGEQYVVAVLVPPTTDTGGGAGGNALIPGPYESVMRCAPGGAGLFERRADGAASGGGQTLNGEFEFREDPLANARVADVDADMLGDPDTTALMRRRFGHEGADGPGGLFEVDAVLVGPGMYTQAGIDLYGLKEGANRQVGSLADSMSRELVVCRSEKGGGVVVLSRMPESGTATLHEGPDGGPLEICPVPGGAKHMYEIIAKTREGRREVIASVRARPMPFRRGIGAPDAATGECLPVYVLRSGTDGLPVVVRCDRRSGKPTSLLERDENGRPLTVREEEGGSGEKTYRIEGKNGVGRTYLVATYDELSGDPGGPLHGRQGRLLGSEYFIGRDLSGRTAVVELRDASASDHLREFASAEGGGKFPIVILRPPFSERHRPVTVINSDKTGKPLEVSRSSKGNEYSDVMGTDADGDRYLVCTFFNENFDGFRDGRDGRGRRVTIVEADVAGRPLVIHHGGTDGEGGGSGGSLADAMIVDSDERGRPLSLRREGKRTSVVGVSLSGEEYVLGSFDESDPRSATATALQREGNDRGIIEFRSPEEVLEQARLPTEGMEMPAADLSRHPDLLRPGEDSGGGGMGGRPEDTKVYYLGEDLNGNTIVVERNRRHPAMGIVMTAYDKQGREAFRQDQDTSGRPLRFRDAKGQPGALELVGTDERGRDYIIGFVERREAAYEGTDVNGNRSIVWERRDIGRPAVLHRENATGLQTLRLQGSDGTPLQLISQPNGDRHVLMRGDHGVREEVCKYHINSALTPGSSESRPGRPVFQYGRGQYNQPVTVVKQPNGRLIVLQRVPEADGSRDPVTGAQQTYLVADTTDATGRPFSMQPSRLGCGLEDVVGRDADNRQHAVATLNPTQHGLRIGTDEDGHRAFVLPPSPGFPGPIVVSVGPNGEILRLVQNDEGGRLLRYVETLEGEVRADGLNKAGRKYLVAHCEPAAQETSDLDEWGLDLGVVYRAGLDPSGEQVIVQMNRSGRQPKILRQLNDRGRCEVLSTDESGFPLRIVETPQPGGGGPVQEVVGKDVYGREYLVATLVAAPGGKATGTRARLGEDAKGRIVHIVAEGGDGTRPAMVGLTGTGEPYMIDRDSLGRPLRCRPKRDGGVDLVGRDANGEEYLLASYYDDLYDAPRGFGACFFLGRDEKGQQVVVHRDAFSGMPVLVSKSGEEGKIQVIAADVTGAPLNVVPLPSDAGARAFKVVGYNSEDLPCTLATFRPKGQKAKAGTNMNGERVTVFEEDLNGNLLVVGLDASSGAPYMIDSDACGGPLQLVQGRDGTKSVVGRERDGEMYRVARLYDRVDARELFGSGDADRKAVLVEGRDTKGRQIAVHIDAKNRISVVHLEERPSSDTGDKKVSPFVQTTDEVGLPLQVISPVWNGGETCEVIGTNSDGKPYLIASFQPTVPPLLDLDTKNSDLDLKDQRLAVALRQADNQVVAIAYGETSPPILIDRDRSGQALVMLTDSQGVACVKGTDKDDREYLLGTLRGGEGSLHRHHKAKYKLGKDLVGGPLVVAIGADGFPTAIGRDPAGRAVVSATDRSGRPYMLLSRGEGREEIVGRHPDTSQYKLGSVPVRAEGPCQLGKAGACEGVDLAGRPMVVIAAGHELHPVVLMHDSQGEPFLVERDKRGAPLVIQPEETPGVFAVVGEDNLGRRYKLGTFESSDDPRRPCPFRKGGGGLVCALGVDENGRHVLVKEDPQRGPILISLEEQDATGVPRVRDADSSGKPFFWRQVPGQTYGHVLGRDTSGNEYVVARIEGTRMDTASKAARAFYPKQPALAGRDAHGQRVDVLEDGPRGPSVVCFDGEGNKATVIDRDTCGGPLRIVADPRDPRQRTVIGRDRSGQTYTVASYQGWTGLPSVFRTAKDVYGRDVVVQSLPEGGVAILCLDETGDTMYVTRDQKGLPLKLKPRGPEGVVEVVGRDHRNQLYTLATVDDGPFGSGGLAGGGASAFRLGTAWDGSALDVLERGPEGTPVVIMRGTHHHPVIVTRDKMGRPLRMVVDDNGVASVMGKDSSGKAYTLGTFPRPEGKLNLPGTEESSYLDNVPHPSDFAEGEGPDGKTPPFADGDAVPWYVHPKGQCTGGPEGSPKGPSPGSRGGVEGMPGPRGVGMGASRRGSKRGSLGGGSAGSPSDQLREHLGWQHTSRRTSLQGHTLRHPGSPGDEGALDEGADGGRFSSRGSRTPLATDRNLSHVNSARRREREAELVDGFVAAPLDGHERGRGGIGSLSPEGGRGGMSPPSPEGGRFERGGHMSLSGEGGSSSGEVMRRGSVLQVNMRMRMNSEMAVEAGLLRVERQEQQRGRAEAENEEKEENLREVGDPILLDHPGRPPERLLQVCEVQAHPGVDVDDHPGVYPLEAQTVVLPEEAEWDETAETVGVDV